MPIVDASFLVAAWNSGQLQHGEANKQLAGAGAASLRVNAGGLVEASRIIRRAANLAGRDGGKVAREFLGAFLSLPGASILSSHAHEAWELHEHERALSFPDAWVVVQAQAAKDEVWSYDKRVLAAARKK